MYHALWVAICIPVLRRKSNFQKYICWFIVVGSCPSITAITIRAAVITWKRPGDLACWHWHSIVWEGEGGHWTLIWFQLLPSCSFCPFVCNFSVIAPSSGFLGWWSIDPRRLKEWRIPSPQMWRHPYPCCGWLKVTQLLESHLCSCDSSSIHILSVGLRNSLVPHIGPWENCPLVCHWFPIMRE